MDFKKSALPAAIGLALGVGGGAAIPKNVEVTPRAAYEILQSASAQDLVDTYVCQEQMKTIRAELNMQRKANRLLASGKEPVDNSTLESALRGCAEKLAACEAKYENAIHPTTGPRRDAPPRDE